MLTIMSVGLLAKLKALVIIQPSAPTIRPLVGPAPLRITPPIGPWEMMSVPPDVSIWTIEGPTLWAASLIAFCWSSSRSSSVRAAVVLNAIRPAPSRAVTIHFMAWVPF